MIKKLIETYLENDNFLFYDVNKNIEGNNIQLLLGLRLPGIYLTLKEIIYYIRNEIIIKNFNIERDIFNLRDEDRIDFGKELENYRNRLKNNLKNAEKEILKNKAFNKINNIEKKRPKEIYQFYSLLINDYFLIFLSENLHDIKELYKNFDCYKNLLNLILCQRFKNGNSFFEIEPIKSFTKKIVWMETYRQYISIILKIYEKISKYESDLINKINILIKDNEISLDEDEIRNPYHTLDLKSPFYYATEALFRIIFDNKFLEKLKGQNFYDYINLLKTITEESLIIYENLSIDPKEILIIQEFINIEGALNNVNKSNEENLLNIHKILTKSDTKIKVSEINLSNNINQLYNFLLNNLGDTDIFQKLIIDIFVIEFKRIKNDKYKQTLLEIILKNNNLISYSYPFMSLIINQFLSSEPSLIGDNI